MTKELFTEKMLKEVISQNPFLQRKELKFKSVHKNSTSHSTPSGNKLIGGKYKNGVFHYMEDHPMLLLHDISHSLDFVIQGKKERLLKDNFGFNTMYSKTPNLIRHTRAEIRANAILIYILNNLSLSAEQDVALKFRKNVNRMIYKSILIVYKVQNDVYYRNNSIDRKVIPELKQLYKEMVVYYNSLNFDVLMKVWDEACEMYALAQENKRCLDIVWRLFRQSYR